MTESPAPAPADRLVLPGLLGDVQRWCGDEIAVALARAWGGQKHSVPRNPKPDSQIARVVGIKAARIIGQHLGGGERPWPSARRELRWMDARRLRRLGWPIRRIAARLKMNERGVYLLVRGVEPGAGAMPAAAPAGCPVCGRRGHRRACPPSDDRQMTLPL